MAGKLGLDFGKVEHARSLAGSIAKDVQNFVNNYTTVAVERTLCRLMGIDGVDANGVPLPNVVVEHLKERNALSDGVLSHIPNALPQYGLSPQEIAEKIASSEIDLLE